MHAQGTLGATDAKINQTFLFAAFMSAVLRLLSLLLYQTAIALSPLSATVPYLSFTPAMLIVTAYLLIGEQPSSSGLFGVCVVTLGGYLLAFSTAPSVATAKKADAPLRHENVADGAELGYEGLGGDATKHGRTGAMVCYVADSVAVLAEILLRSPRKIFIFIIKKIYLYDQSIQK